jgi:HD-GYP domain-containing protein (c-di-GMP phosphodiesterase class II)
LKKRTLAIVTATVALSIVALLALYNWDSSSDPRLVRAAIAFAVLSTAASVMPYALADRVNGSAAFLTFLASIVLAPSYVSVLGTAVVIAVCESVKRNSFGKIAFNVAQHSLAMSFGVLGYLMAGGKAAVLRGEISPVPILAAFVGFFIANSIAVGAVVASETEQSTVFVWKTNSLANIFIDLVALPFVYVLAKAYVDYGVLAAAAAVALVVIVRQLNSTNEELNRSNRELLELTVNTLEARDPYTSGHSRRVSDYCQIIGLALELPSKQLARLRVASLLHDVGKIHESFAPILSKPGKLTPVERALMESHPIKGAELVKISSHLRDVVEPIRHHHEAWDGSGYPDGLHGTLIPQFSRIIAIADTIDAMASDRPYRRGLSAEKIRAELVRMIGIQFDPEILGALLSAGVIDRILALACEEHASLPSEPSLQLASSQ